MADPHILADRTEIVEIDSVQPHDRNPRVGNVEVIAQSLAKNSQYRPIVVQRSTGKILAGNHTWLAAKSLGWEAIAVVYIDVDDEQAKRIIVADNRTADLGTYDMTILTEILESLPDTEGTGYSEADRQMLMDNLMETTEDTPRIMEDIVRPAPQVVVRTHEDMQREERQTAITSGGSVGGMVRPDVTQPEDEGLQQFDDFRGELTSVLQMREDILFPSDNEYGFPPLIPEMIATPDDVPSLKTWVSQNITPDRPDQWWLYNYNLGSSVGIPYDRTVLGFYTHDDKFETWWASPAAYTAKTINAGITIMVQPDFSRMHGEVDAPGGWFPDGLPPILNMLNLYRALWLSRFFQEAGIKVIPNMVWGWPGDIEQWAKYGMPKNVPTAMIQMQTFREDHPSDAKMKEIGLEYIFQESRPQKLFVYTGIPGQRFTEHMANKYNIDTEVEYLWSYSKIKNDVRKQREDDNKAFGKTGLFTGGSRVSQEDVERMKATTATPESRYNGDKLSGEIDDEAEGEVS